MGNASSFYGNLLKSLKTLIIIPNIKKKMKIKINHNFILKNIQNINSYILFVIKKSFFYMNIIVFLAVKCLYTYD